MLLDIPNDQCIGHTCKYTVQVCGESDVRVCDVTMSLQNSLHALVCGWKEDGKEPSLSNLLSDCVTRWKIIIVLSYGGNTKGRPCFDVLMTSMARNVDVGS